MEKDQDFTHWYKKSLEEFKPVPPLDSWEDISKQLDIDEVWENLHVNLDHIDTKEKYFNYSKHAERVVLFAACLLLLFPVFTKKFYNYSTSKRDTSTATEEHYLTSSAERQDSMPPKIENAGPNLRSGSGDLIVDNPATDESDSDELDNSNVNDEKVKKITLTAKDEHHEEQFRVSKNTRLSDNFLTDNSGSNFEKAEEGIDFAPVNSFGIKLLYSPSALMINRKKPEKAKNESGGGNIDDNVLCESNIPYKFAIGIHGAVKNHWLLNQTTYRGLSSEELNTTLPSFGKSLGITAVYNLKPRIALQAELAYSDEGQRYRDYINGRYAKKSIDLKYFSLSAIFKYRLSPLVGFARASNSSILLGLYNSRLLKAEEKIAHKSKGVINEYKPSDAGFLVGFEYEYAVSKSAVITSGIRFKYGFKNIYAGNERIPSSLNETRNGSVDFNISLLFLIP